MRRNRGYQYTGSGRGDFESANLFSSSLDLEIDLCENVLKRVPDDVQALSLLGQSYTRRGLYKKGLDVDKKLCRLRPNDSVAHYNLACSHSLLGLVDEALEVLQKAVDLGYADYVHMRSDKDLNNIREHPRYKEIAGRLLARIKSSRAGTE